MIQSFRVTSASVSDRGLSDKRPQNEDAYLEIPRSGIFAVADGVGGAQAGEVASQMAMEILGEAFINVDEHADAEHVMRRALMQANSAINQMSHELPQLSHMATTVVALHIAGNIATIAHAGDSRLYRIDGEGVLYRETDDHSVVAEEVRAGRMTEEQAENHPGKNVINRALGAEPTVEIDTKTIMVGENSTFLICSDGVTRHISDAEIKGLLGANATPESICDRIKQICFERGAEDNLTAVIVRLGAAERSNSYDVSAALETERDEVTVATARSNVAASLSNDDDDEDLLEIETAVLKTPTPAGHEPDLFFDDLNPSLISVVRLEPVMHAQETNLSLAADLKPGNVQQPSVVPSGSHASPVKQAVDIIDEATDEDQGPMSQVMTADGTDVASLPRADAVPFQGNVSEANANDPAETSSPAILDRSGSTGRMLAAVSLLLIGSLVGLAAYHFFLANRSQPAMSVPITEMHSSNQPQTAFEENRRTLDKNPEAALPRYEAEPKDAENRFLLGRAYLLLGRYPEARKAFQESREQIAAGQVDPDNSRTIQTEIAIAMAVTNDTLVQNSLKKELDDAKTQPNQSANAGPSR